MLFIPFCMFIIYVFTASKSVVIVFKLLLKVFNNSNPSSTLSEAVVIFSSISSRVDVIEIASLSLSSKVDFPVEFKRHHGEYDGARVSFFRAEWVSGEVEVDGKEIVEARWCKRKEIKKLVEEKYWEVVRVFLK